MKIGLYYFSGTGNTRLIAGEFKAAFVAQGADCELIPVEKITLKPGRSTLKTVTCGDSVSRCTLSTRRGSSMIL